MNGQAEGIRTIPRMLDSCQGQWRRTATQHMASLTWACGAALMTLPTITQAAAPAASGVSTTVAASSSPPAAMWLFLTLAFLAVTGLAYALGGWRQRAALTQPLFEARASLRQVQQLLQDQHRWQTDAQHHLVRWQAPGQAPSSDATLLRQFEPALHAALQAQQSFVGLQVRSDPALLAVQRWEWRGVAQHDDTGGFIGFVGTARPLDEADRLSLQALALPGLMQAQTGAALLLSQAGPGFQLQAFNAAAARLWPTLQAGMPWTSLAPLLPTELPQPLLTDINAMLKLAPAAAPQTTDAGPWRAETFCTPVTGQHGSQP
jgi:hypothetical protein